jgi:uncharacterized membrane protein
MNRGAAIAATLVLILMMDYVWLTFNRTMYASMVQNVQNQKLAINLTAAVVAYIFVAMAFMVIVIYNIEKVIDKITLTEACVIGGAAGLSIYGIYNATNAAIFANYSLDVVIFDTLWGTTLFAVAASAYVWMRSTKN